MPEKRLTLHEVKIQEDGSVRITTDLSPEEMNILLTVGLLACMQHGVMLASLAEKMGYTKYETNPVDESVGTLNTPNWEQLLDGETTNVKKT